MSELAGGPGQVWFPCLQEVSFSSHLQEGEGRRGGLFPGAAALPGQPSSATRRVGRPAPRPARRRLQAPSVGGAGAGRGAQGSLLHPASGPAPACERAAPRTEPGTLPPRPGRRQSAAPPLRSPPAAAVARPEAVTARSQAGPVPRPRGGVSDLQALSFGRWIQPASPRDGAGLAGWAPTEPSVQNRAAPAVPQRPGRGSWRARPALGSRGWLRALHGAGGGGASWGGFAYCPTSPAPPEFP